MGFFDSTAVFFERLSFNSRQKIRRKTACLGVLLFYIPSSWAVDYINFQLDWLPGGDKAPVYVGVEQGFFEQEGIKVKINAGRGSTDSITKVATGQAQVGLTDITALMGAKAGNQVPVTAIYNIFSEAAHAFYTLDSSGIEKVADVKGKKVATSPFTSSNTFFPQLLRLNNVDVDSVRLIKADPGALNPMLLNGSAHAIISWMTDAQKYTAQGEKIGKGLRIIPWSGAGLSIYSTSIIANDRFLKKRPDLAKRFLRAYKKAIQYTWENPEISGKHVHALVPEVDAAEAAATIRSIRGLVYNEASEKFGLGTFNPQRLEKTWKVTAEAQGYAVDSLDLNSVVSYLYMPESDGVK